MSAALVLMITDGQDTQKRTEDLQEAIYAIGPAWRHRADEAAVIAFRLASADVWSSLL